MARDIDDDAYIAELLKQDAKKATKTYELVGIDAFNPRRMNSRAPRPNKGFLQHLIRQTDSHNAALLAKEAEESRARLRKMNRDQKRAREWEEGNGGSAGGRLTPVASDNNVRSTTPSRRRDRSEDESRHKRRRGERDRDGSASASSHRHRDRSRDGHRRKRRHDSEEEDRSQQKRRRSRSPRDKSRKGKYSEEQERWKPRRRDYNDGRHRRQRSHSRTTSPSRSRSRSPQREKHGKRDRHRDRIRSRSPRRNHITPNSHKDDRRSNSRTATPASDSDPLEAIVGPLPPPPEPTVRSKGRGAYKANNMGIESRFSSTYDPSTDVRANSDVEDDWGDALEALRDRARWQQQGADRLKAAGFTDEQVKKWEKGDTQNEEDVIWTKKGQAREWDRGKVLDEDGHVELKADFGRLK
ncbi:uncharacterized protein ALTATR162_LOCUS9002 [Alternaria atra]|uniref:Pre-mRNA-splicing factor 38B n=1 Tax=Alternaria atra TaxID=119953 RepID=A0A8J2N376_9PLEO|nr:uncharacterized protein ALTATR162_LOCUS9002 [Alternaria atra]CAG5179039.1 unnamed protein product [Alternaria atra]